MKKYFHIFLIFILVLVFVLNSFVNAFAIAIVDDSILLGIIGTVLIGCGIVGFNDVDTLKTTAQSFWTSIPDDVKDFFNGLVDLATGHGLGSFTFELTTEVVNAIQNWLSGVTSADGGSVSVSSSFNEGSYYILQGYSILYTDNVSQYKSDPSPLCISGIPVGSSIEFVTTDGSSVFLECYTISDDGYSYFKQYYFDSNGNKCYANNYYRYFYLRYVNSLQLYFGTFSGWSSIPVDLSLTTSIPFDSTWSTDSEDEEKKLVPGKPVTMPKGLVNSDGVIDSDVLGGMTTEGVRTGSTTTDTPTEQTWLESILSALDGLLDGVLEGIKSLFIPEGFSWDFFLDELGSVVSPPQAIDLKSYVQNIEIPDVKVNMKGHELTIVDNSMLRDNIVTFRKFIGAFMAILVMIFNYNMFMKLMGYGGFSVTDSGRAGNTLTPSTPVNQNLLTYPTNRG